MDDNGRKWVEIYPHLDKLDIPFNFHAVYEKGITTLDKEDADNWILSRIAP